MDQIYSCYSNFINTIDDISNSSFKSNPKYTYMLEHVNYNQGVEYLKLIKKNFPNISEDIIKKLVSINDEIGNTQKYNFDKISCSPTSLRYIYHSLLILEHLKDLYSKTDISISVVELGGGYGGLCLIFNHLYKEYYSKEFKLENYSIIDLPNPCILQRKYLEYHKISCKSYDAFNYDSFLQENKHKETFLISNYCFSELGKENQQSYIKNLFPIIQHGFITWNCIEPYNFGKQIIKQQREEPLTGDNKNYYIYF
jgi:hypothetical protein